MLWFIDGVGVDLVVEVGGCDMLLCLVVVMKIGGIVLVIGGFSSFGGLEFGLLLLVGGFWWLYGFMVGSCVMFDDVVWFVDVKWIKLVVDWVFGFDEVL